MTAQATIPVTVSPEAAERIAALGRQAEVQQMIEYALGHIPRLKQIEVVLVVRYDEDTPPGIAVEASSSRPLDPNDQTRHRLTQWLATTFSPRVLEYVTLMELLVPDDAG